MYLKFEEGQMVKMVGNDNMIVLGAIGTIAKAGVAGVSVCWDNMSAFKPDHRYRNGFKEILTTDVSPNSIKVVDHFSSWTTKPQSLKRKYCIDDCVKYIKEDSKWNKHGELLCVYAMDYSKHIVKCIKLSNYNLVDVDMSDCALESPHYAFEKGAKVTTIRESSYTEVGRTGYICATDYRTPLPYLVRWDNDNSETWVAACTIARQLSDIGEALAEELGMEIEKEAPIDPVLENGFSREVTFYERD